MAIGAGVLPEVRRERAGGVLPMPSSPLLAELDEDD